MASHLPAHSDMVHREKLLRYLRARGVVDDAEDLLREVWIKVSAAEPRAASDELSSLYRTANDLLIRQNRELRLSQSENTCKTKGNTETTHKLSNPKVAPDQVDFILRQLGDEINYAFRRHRVDLVPQCDIAKELGISLPLVQAGLQAAYRVIAQMYDP